MRVEGVEGGAHLPVDSAVVLDPLQALLDPISRQQPPIAHRPWRVGPRAVDDILAPVAEPGGLDDEPDLNRVRVRVRVRIRVGDRDRDRVRVSQAGLGLGLGLDPPLRA